MSFQNTENRVGRFLGFFAYKWFRETQSFHIVEHLLSQKIGGSKDRDDGSEQETAFNMHGARPAKKACSLCIPFLFPGAGQVIPHAKDCYLFLYCMIFQSYYGSNRT
jgi:hypothetical protein